MPELPEVETVKNKLYPHLINQKINSVDVFYSKYDELKTIKNEKILDIKRKGKYLIFVLDNYYMISHLRMEGKYFVKDLNSTISKHDLVRFNFDNFILIYNDVRKFGVFNVFKKDVDIYNVYPLKDVGKEPFDITNIELYSSLKQKDVPIKTCLLDQKNISGLGNIYVDEVLFMSNIHPFRYASSITKDEVQAIIENSIKVLNSAIEKGGTTILSFESFNGEIGHFQTSLKVHQKEYSRCENCNQIILKTRCNGRGTYYCPSCQKLNVNQKRIALTGGFSSGKSTALSIIKDLGFATFSLDEIYHDIFESSKDMLREIKKTFNTTELSVLRKTVFNDKEKIKQLNEITHKYIIKELYRRIESDNSEYVFVEVPLLYESNLEKTFDKVIDVYESDEIQDLLLKRKGYTKEDYKLRMSNQLSREEKRERSDFILYNNGTLLDLKNNIQELLKIMEV